jgi:heat shock protein HslJ
MRLPALFATALFLTSCGSVGGAYTSALAGTTWRLEQLRAADGVSTVPADPARYTLSFTGDGGVSMQLDCNRGNGTWTSNDDGEVSITPLAVTRAFCGEGSLDTRVARDIGSVRSYQRDGAQLRLTMSDGGALVWQRQN